MKRVLVFTILISVSLFLSAPTPDYYINSLEFSILSKEREFQLFAHHLAYIESRDNPEIVNSIGAIGLYQFMPSTLKRLGYDYVTLEAFKDDPGIFDRQEQYNALKQLILLNKIDLIPYVNFIGDTIKGIEITKAGLLGGMHLGGIGAVSLFLLSDGLIDKSDNNGTKISSYIKTFGIYEF